METRHLKVFVAVYKARSFTKAAEELYTSQPTVSEHIQNLESRLNCKLFDRLGRSILPTAEAEILYPKARLILDDLERLQQEISEAGKVISGELIIGASTIPGTYILPQLAASFKKTFPEISFEIRISDSAQIVDAVAANELLFGIVGAKLSSPKLSFQPLIEDELVVAAASANPVPEAIDSKDFINLPFIIRERGSGTRKSTEQLLSQHNLSSNRLNIVATLGSSAAVKEAIKANLGVSVISRLAIREELANGMLKSIKVQGLDLRRHFYVVISPKRTLPHHYDLFLQKLLQDTR
jgi:DNA-binding transcriptional LysR family regulator